MSALKYHDGSNWVVIPIAKGDQGDVGPQGPPGADGVTDHGALTGLSDDDHPQYILASGARAFSGEVGLNNSEVFFRLHATAQPADGGKWILDGFSGKLRIAPTSDALAFQAPEIAFTRTGNLELNVSPSSGAHATNKSYVDTQDALKANLTGATFTGPIEASHSTLPSIRVSQTGEALDEKNWQMWGFQGDLYFSAYSDDYTTGFHPMRLTRTGVSAAEVDMSGANAVWVPYPTNANHASDKSYVDAVAASKANLTGATFTGQVKIETSSYPNLTWRDTDEADNQRTQMYVGPGGPFYFSHASDGGGETNIFTAATDGRVAFNKTPTAAEAAPTAVDQLTRKDYVDAAVAALKAEVYGVVNHGATASTARPSGYAGIIWYGSVQPTNATGVDIVIRTDEAT